MKIKNTAKVFLFCLLFLVSFGIVQAKMDHFDVEIEPEKAKVGESIDITIKAVDENGELVEDYTGTVLIFSYSDTDMKVPKALENNSYEFTSADQGEIKFENGFSFTKKGINDISIFDLESTDDEVLGEAKIEITEDSTDETLTIEILSPEEGLTIPNTTTKVSGSTSKNHRVKILVNDKEYETTSNTNGIYELEVFDLNNGTNTIKTQVLNAENQVVGESKEVSIKVEDGNIVFKNIKLIPEEVFTESIYEIEAAATPNLEEVHIVINDEIIPLEEKDEGIYIGKTYSPSTKGTYKVDINLKDEIGHQIKELGITELKVNELLVSPTPEENTNEDTQITKEEGEEENNQETTRDPLKITGLKLVKLKTKSILTWDRLEKAKAYNVYKKNPQGKLELVDSVKDPKFEVEIDTKAKKVTYEQFAVKAVGEDGAGESYEGDLSQATKIKTGPEMLIILIVSLFLTGLFFVFNFRKNA